MLTKVYIKYININISIRIYEYYMILYIININILDIIYVFNKEIKKYCI